MKQNHMLQCNVYVNSTNSLKQQWYGQFYSLLIVKVFDVLMVTYLPLKECSPLGLSYLQADF